MTEGDNSVAIVVGHVRKDIVRCRNVQTIDVLGNKKTVAVVEINHHVFAATTAEDEHVVACSADHRVVTMTSIEYVVAIAPRHELFAGACVDHIVAVAAQQCVATCPAVYDIVARPTLNEIAVATNGDDVVT